jgi:small neutral amino acid transporter SnatA (MarC family)
MTYALLVLAYLAAVNPGRLRLSMPKRPGGQTTSVEMLAASALVLGLVAVGLVTAEPLLDALRISPESFRIAAGLVVALVGGWVMLFPSRHEEPELAGWGVVLVPLAFPLLITPELVALAIASGADEPFGSAFTAAAIGLAAGAAVGFVRRVGAADAILRGFSRLAGLGLVVVGIWMIIDGIRDV